MNNGNIGDRIRSARGSRQQSDIAKAMGWPISKLSKIESGKQNISGEEIISLSNVLDVSPNVLTGTEDQPLVRVHQEYFKSFVEAGKELEEVTRSNFSATNARNMVTKTIPDLIASVARIDSSRYKIYGSIGLGIPAEIAWIGIFDKKITTSATHGVYVVYLWSHNHDRVSLALQFGTTELSKLYKRKNLKHLADICRSYIDVPTKFNNSIHLDAETLRGKNYELGTIIGKDYDLNKDISDDQMIRDLLDMMDIYKELVTVIGKRSFEDFMSYILADEDGDIEDNITQDTGKSEKIITVGKDIKETSPVVPKKKDPQLKDRTGGSVYRRSSSVKSEALANADYKCEVDFGHHTFVWNNHVRSDGSSVDYMEGHHLIPVCQYDMFDYNLDVPANVCCLCNKCHDILHHGTIEDKKPILKILFEKHYDDLKKAGLLRMHDGTELTLDLLVKMYE